MDSLVHQKLQNCHSVRKIQEGNNEIDYLKSCYKFIDVFTNFKNVFLLLGSESDLMARNMRTNKSYNLSFTC